MRVSPGATALKCKGFFAAAPLGLGFNVGGRTGGLSHRLMSNVPPGQLAARTNAKIDGENFLALTLMPDKSKG